MATTEFPVVEQVFEIPIELLFLSKTNPRGDPTPEALSDLAADVANRGVVQAVVVRPKQERFEVVFGKRRFLASEIAKKATVPCVIREMNDDKAFELQIVENLQRENLHPLVEAAAFKRLYDKAYKQTKKHDQAITLVAERIGKKYRPEEIAKRLKLSDLIDEAKQAFRSERLILGHAEELARLRPEEQTATLKWLLSRTTRANGKEVPIVPGVPELRVWIRQNIFLDLRRAPFDTSDPNLHAKMGPCSSCEFKTGNQPGLFDDVQQGDTCTVPSCWRQKRDNHLVQIATASTKELGVKKVLKVGLGYRSWNHDRIPVDAYIEFASSYRLVKIGNECPNTKPGIITFIAHPSDAQNLKIGSQVFVCTESGKCSKHNHADSRSSTRKTYEEMADTRMGNLRRDTQQRIRAAIIAAVIQAALKRERSESKKHLIKYQAIAVQMHSDLFFDRHRDLCKLLQIEPSLDSYENKDWRGTSKRIFKGNPMAMMVAMTIMHCYHVGTYGPASDPLKVFVSEYGVNAQAIEKEVKAAIAKKIETIQGSLKRRKAKAAKAKEAGSKQAKSKKAKAEHLKN